MPPAVSAAGRPRSAEQTARLLLSNAFRHDTWECAVARKQVQSQGGVARTLRVSFRSLEKQRVAASHVDAVNLALFDPSRRIFVGATFQVEATDLARPLVVQVDLSQVLVVETVVQDSRASMPLEEYRVTRWGFCAIENLKNGANLLELRPGTGHLLLVEKSAWPAESLLSAPSEEALICDVSVDHDAALTQVMDALVPPGVFVSEDFTRASPQPGASLFRLCVNHIELSGLTEESAANLADADADWSVAAVAHNGLQQLSKGSEVPLMLERRGVGRDEAHGDSPSRSSSSNSETPHGRAAIPKTVLLRSDIPLEIDRLPVHSATSLVLAIRRRAPGSRAFAVVGFSVLPLCMMPMQDRDIRVENLPALRGPFSCEDARLLMVDSTSPYGRVPIAVTLTVEYHNTGVTSSAIPVAVPAAAGEAHSPPSDPGMRVLPEEITRDEVSTANSSASSTLTTRHRDTKLTQVLSTADATNGAESPSSPSPIGGVTAQAAIPAGVDATQSRDLPTASTSAAATGEAVTAAALGAGDSVSIFKLLCTIMEELHKVRESQEVIMRQASIGGGGGGMPTLSPALQDRLNKGLADGGVDVIDLTPRPLAVSWKARKRMQDGLQPIVHPVHGALLDDTAPAFGRLTSSLYGFRVEGITVDAALHMPADLCLLFSFGPLPLQQVGPLHVTSVEQTPTNESFKVFDHHDRAGLVWWEPTKSLQSGSMRKYKSASNSVVYVHVYDALTMFYVATAHVPLDAFRRPSPTMSASLTPTDAVLQRDLCMTEQVVPDKVYPVMRQAGQLHLTLFAVGMAAGGADAGEGDGRTPPALASVRVPGDRGRVIIAKKLQHADRLATVGMESPAANGRKETPTILKDAAAPSVRAAGEPGGAAAGTLHWQRAQHFKDQLRETQQSLGMAPQLPGVPDEHVRAAQEAAELEYRLRQLEHERAVVKSKRIAEALLSRLTVEHHVHVISWRPEVVRTAFVNPFGVAMSFYVEIDPADAKVCTTVDAASFCIGPHEKIELPLAVRLSLRQATVTGADQSPPAPEQQEQHITARVYSEKRELVCCIRVHATVEPPVVDRRYEIFGAPGTEISKRILSRNFSAASFPDPSRGADLLQRMRDLCTFTATSSEKTSVSTNAVLDPITQTYITAWEEATVTTRVPAEMGWQRIEYVTLFYDAAMSRVYETWELCIFACESIMTRDIYWGQTTALGLPAEGTDDLYCSDSSVKVARSGASYVLRLHPRDVGTQRVLLHTLQNDTLKKSLLTIPTVYPTPTYTQVIELSLAEAQGPVLRRLTFVNRGDREEVFQVHHNYKFNLRVTPSTFALAPGDSQFVGLQFDLLTLPPGQLEGRWPVWIFLNNNEDKTVESYHLEVVLRAHPVVRLEG